MESINTGTLVHQAKELRNALEEGKSFRWESRGKVIAVIQPPPSDLSKTKRNWLERAASAGATNASGRSVSGQIYTERDDAVRT